MTEPAPDLAPLFAEIATPAAAGGNAPFHPAPGRAWLVVEGGIDLFAVREGGAEARAHLGTVPPGELLLGVAAGDGVSLTAVPLLGTRLLEADGAALARLPAGELAPRIDSWLARLLEEIAPAAAPRAFRELRAGEEIVLEKEGAVRPREGVVWARLDEGSGSFLGEPALALAPGAAVALPESAWLVGAAGARLAGGSTADLMAGGELSPRLDAFHALFLRCVRLRIDRTLAEERARLDRKAEFDRATVQGAYARLAAILSPLARGEAGGGGAADPLLAACRHVGRVLGVEFQAPKETSVGARQGNRLAAICAASRVRFRRVILRDVWWRQDNGPMIAFRVLDGQRKETRPVALIPDSARSYRLVDPAEPAPVKVDAAVAESLSGEAYMFYTPLPERQVTPGDLLRAALRGRRKDLATILLMGAAGGLLGLLVPVLTGQVFGNVIPGANRPQLVQITLALVVSALAAGSFQITRSLAVLRLGGKIDGAVQSAVWDRLLALPVSFFRQFTVGDLSNRSMGIDSIRELVTGNVLTSILAAVFSVFSFALLFHYSWRLALLATALVAVLLGVTALLVWLQLRHQRELLHLQGRVSSMLFGLIGGIAKLRVGGAEQRAFALWANRFAEQRERAIRAQRIANVQTTFNAVYGVLTTIGLFAMVGLSARSELSLGEFLAFNAAFGQFLGSALAMIGVFSSLLTLVPIYERLSPILEEVPEVDTTKAEVGDLAGEIEFSHVSFRYQEDGPAILDDVSFRAAAGEFIALVGPSGAGKSTCLRLILGFERPTSGSIYFDGQDLASLSLHSVRRQLGVVLQSGRPMVGDIFTNIVGSSSLGIEDAWEAARMAGLEEDVKAMPMGMHTVISEGAETFSGGQRQRLLIARAIVHRPRIILFDEATSALDNRTQEIVSRSLERLKATRIVIAHRLSTILNADRIYVLQNGRVVESGTYAELLRQGGVFAQLASRQIA
ncbi:MAG: NHLP bacteriocin export ABC transporter permease/ATPase subunit [Thermoanaerobaculia bacterium]